MIDPDAFVTVRYSCDGCGIADRPVRVPARGQEDVIEWMGVSCMPTLAQDHARMSPKCMTDKLDQVFVPVGDDEKVGALRRQ